MKKLLFAAMLLTTLSVHAVTYDCVYNQAAPYSVDFVRSGQEAVATVGHNTFNFIQTSAATYDGASFQVYEMDMPQYVAHIYLAKLLGIDTATMQVDQKSPPEAYGFNGLVRTSTTMTALCQARQSKK